MSFPSTQTSLQTLPLKPLKVHPDASVFSLTLHQDSATGPVLRGAPIGACGPLCPAQHLPEPPTCPHRSIKARAGFPPQSSSPTSAEGLLSAQLQDGGPAQQTLGTDPRTEDTHFLPPRDCPAVQPRRHHQSSPNAKPYSALSPSCQGRLRPRLGPRSLGSPPHAGGEAAPLLHTLRAAAPAAQKTTSLLMATKRVGKLTML